MLSRQRGDLFHGEKSQFGHLDARQKCYFRCARGATQFTVGGVPHSELDCLRTAHSSEPVARETNSLPLLLHQQTTDTATCTCMCSELVGDSGKLVIQETRVHFSF